MLTNDRNTSDGTGGWEDKDDQDKACFYVSGSLRIIISSSIHSQCTKSSLSNHQLMDFYIVSFPGYCEKGSNEH